MSGRAIPNYVWVVVVTFFLLVAFGVDDMRRPPENSAILFAISVTLAALRWSPRTVISIAAVALLGDLYSIYRTNSSSMTWPITFTSLLVACLLAIFIAVRHAEMMLEREHDRELITAAERLRQPLTVILGYAQLLCHSDELSPSARRSLGTIERAANDMRVVLSNSLNDIGPPPDNNP